MVSFKMVLNHHFEWTFFVDTPRTHKIFIEPHEKQKLSLTSKYKIRIHGCKAIRHDDHIHLEVK